MPAANVIMQRAAELLNDPARSLFSYAVQIPMLNMALAELREEMERADVSGTKKMSAIIPVVAGATTATLPADLVEIESLEEKNSGAVSTDFSQMAKVSYLPDTTATANFNYWTLDNGVLKFPTTTGNKDIRINYIGRVQPDVVVDTDLVTIPNSESFLAYRTAALCAEFKGENPERAAPLNAMAALAIDRALGIKIKANQVMPVRRRPFGFARKMFG